VLARSGSLQPLVAVSPDHTHPVTACREAATLAALYGRPVGLNLIAGMGTGDVQLPEGQKYERFQEFVAIVARLLSDGHASFDGAMYRIDDARLPIDPAARSRVWAVIAGSSQQAEQAAACGLPRVTHYTPDTLLAPTFAVHVGIITRRAEPEAQSRAFSLFPADSSPRALSPNAPAWAHAIATARTDDRTFFPSPFLTGHRPYPYLVGSYDQIRERVSRLRDGGCEMLVLQRTGELEDLRHVATALSASASPRSNPATGLQVGRP
jgi:alkanesulfonate monooxygenase SsuD/methylene tetrahydromethanopterin reductase-like flavin-dependent oxidoreductase (luciferase family)